MAVLFGCCTKSSSGPALRVSLVNTTDLKAVEAAITPQNKTVVDRKPGESVAFDH